VQAAQFLAVYGRQVCVGILGSNFFRGPRYVVNAYCLLLDELQKKHTVKLLAALADI